MSLAGLNLNLLVALDALLQERHVGRAARRVGVTQSAMSHTLRQLRTLLDDPVLVRSGNEMLPTPYAEQLHPRLVAGLGELNAVVSGRWRNRIQSQSSMSAGDFGVDRHPA